MKNSPEKITRKLANQIAQRNTSLIAKQIKLGNL